MSESSDSDDDQARQNYVAAWRKQREEKEQAAQKEEEAKLRETAKRKAEKASKAEAARMKKTEKKAAKKDQPASKKRKTTGSDDDKSGSGEESEESLSEPEFSNDDEGSEDEEEDGDESAGSDSDDSTSSKRSRANSASSSRYSRSSRSQSGSGNNTDNENDEEKKSDTSTEAGYTLQRMVEMQNENKTTVSEAITASKNVYDTMNQYFEDSALSTDDSVKDAQLVGSLKLVDKDGQRKLDSNLQEALERLRTCAPSYVIHDSITTVVEHIGILSRAVHVLMWMDQQKDSSIAGEDYKRVPNGCIQRLRADILALTQFAEEYKPMLDKQAEAAKSTHEKLSALSAKAGVALGNIPAEVNSIAAANKTPS